MAKMASISSKHPHIHHHHTNTNTNRNVSVSLHLSSSPSILSFPSYRTPSNQPRFCALKVASDSSKTTSNSSQDLNGADLLRKPVVSPAVEGEDEKASDEEGYVDWEDQILEDTVPLVGFVRMILHSDKYGSGDRLSPQHERTILERLLPYHPEYEKKIGSGIDYITVGYHPDFETSRCMFIVRKDGEVVDFSYWKCIKGLIRKNYPLYADSFILRHFRRRKHSD